MDIASSALVVAGCAALAARPELRRLTTNPDGALVALFAGLLAVSVILTMGKGRAVGPVAVPLAVGVAAFAAARLLGGGQAPGGPFVKLLVLNGLAAVAEEAFFRRLVYGVLLDASGQVGAAIAGSAALFALVHVTSYGFWVLPIDLAAGLLLGWQRAASGRWTVPAITHVIANILVLW